MSAPPLVAIVDDDESVRESLPDLIKMLAVATRAFSSAEQFLASGCVDHTRCLILDVVMSGMSGLDLQQELLRRGYRIPIIFVTAQNDQRLRTHLLEQGAAECLFKPFNDTVMLEALRAALRDSTASRKLQ
jgi:FixJ family two-component response regulator